MMHSIRFVLAAASIAVAPHAQADPLQGKELFCWSPDTRFNAAFLDGRAFLVLRQSFTDDDFYQDKYITDSDFPQPQPDNKSVILAENTRSDWKVLDGANQYSQYLRSGNDVTFVNYQYYDVGFFVGKYYPGIILRISFNQGALADYSCEAVVYKQSGRNAKLHWRGDCADDAKVAGRNLGSITGGRVNCRMHR